MSFKIEMLNNQNQFRDYFTHAPVIEEIKSLRDETYVCPSNDNLYFGKWKITWILVKAPFVTIASLFFYAIGFLLRQIGLSSLSLSCYVISQQLTRDQNQLSVQWKYGKDLLVPSSNMPKLWSCDTYSLSPCPLTEVHRKIQKKHVSFEFDRENLDQGRSDFFAALQQKTDKAVWKAFTKKFHKEGMDPALDYLKETFAGSPKLTKAMETIYHYLLTASVQRAQCDVNEIKFHREDGTCRGGSEFFAYLYLMTQDHFKNKGVKHHLWAVAKQFETGYPSQAALLQTFTKLHDKIGMHLSVQKEQILWTYDLDKDEQLCLKKISSLKEGVYCIGLPTHRIFYIKSSHCEGYLWDINNGLIDLSGFDLERKLLTHLKKWHTPGSPDSRIYFEKADVIRQKEVDDALTG